MGVMQDFMEGYKRAWETRDDVLLASLFAADGVYRNTPFDAQHGHDAIRRYWDRVKLQADITLAYDIVDDADDAGCAHWNVTYRVTSEKMFAMWAASTGTGVPALAPGESLPRLELDGLGLAKFNLQGLCTEYRIWWHSRKIG